MLTLVFAEAAASQVVLCGWGRRGGVVDGPVGGGGGGVPRRVGTVVQGVWKKRKVLLGELFR